jgi:glycosyltransferase involved in cell wall biosynthesis
MYFVQEIFPLIREKRPDITFSIVGRQPPDAIQNMNQGIEILGRVEDVRPEIMRGAVFVAPTRIGSGIRLKILEAMALQRPVVSTSVGCEGIDAESETHLLIADDPAPFAASVIRLLEDEAFRTTMTGNAARLIEKKYTWHALARQLSDTYEDIVRKRKDNG